MQEICCPSLIDFIGVIILDIFCIVIFLALVLVVYTWAVRHFGREEPKRCVHKDLTHRYSPTDGDDSSLMRLPAEIITRILQQIASTQPEDLESLLIGVPALCKFVLLVTDHQSNSHALFRATACDTMSLEEFDKDPREAMRFKLVKVFSFLKTDEVVGREELTRDESCLYGRHLNQCTPVFVGGSGTALAGRGVMRDLAKTKEVPRVCIRTCTSDKQHLNMGSRSYSSRWSQIGYGMPFFSDSGSLVMADSEIPVMLGVRLGPWLFPARFLCWRKIKALSVSGLSCFGEYHSMPWVESFKISFVVAKWTIPDVWPVMGLEFGPRLREIYVEYEHPRTPYLLSGPLTSSYLENADGVFSLVNASWSPTLSSAAPPDSELFRSKKDNLISSAQEPLSFLKHFKEATFIGVPDTMLELSDLSAIEKLTWKRLMPTEILDSIPEPFSLQCYNLKHLHISTLLTDERLEPMPRIDAAGLESLELHALPGSTRRWNISSVFCLDSERSKALKKVHIEQEDGLSQTPIEFPLSGLSTILSTVEDLTIRGYLPLFALPTSARQQESYSLGKVTRLKLDINSMPILNIEYVRHVPVVISERRFPALQHLHLHVDVSKPGMHDGDCKVLVDVPPLCKILSFDGMYGTDRCVVDGQVLCGTRYAGIVSYDKVDDVWCRAY